ncbi:hypothetical protein A6R68_15381, partial [Neotoma lepida]
MENLKQLVGGGFLLQIASHGDFVQINQKRVEKDANKANDRLIVGAHQVKKQENKATSEINDIIEEATEFISQNIVIAIDFV